MSELFISRDEAEGDLLSCAAFLAERIPGGEEHAEAVSAVVPRYLARGNVDLAAEFANTVDDPFVRDRLLISVASKCAELDDVEYALQLADAVEEDGLRTQAIERIAKQLAEKGDIERARSLAENILHPDEALAAIAIRQAADGDRDGAVQTLSEIDYPGSAAAAMLQIAHAAISREDADYAAEVLETAEVTEQEIEHEEERIRTLTEVGHSFIDAGRNDKAIAAFDRARGFAEELDNVHRDNTLGAISVGFMRAGSVDLADRTLDMVKDKTQISTALLGFAREYSRRGEMEDALEALDEAYEILRSQHEKETRDSKAKFALFGSIAMQFAGFEKGERAIEMAEKIEDADHAQNALGQIAVILTSQGNTGLARQALKTMSDETQRVFALIGMSDAAAKNDEAAGIGLLKEAAEHASAVEMQAAKASAWNEILARAAAQQSDGLITMAVKEVLSAAGEMRDQRAQVKAVAALSASADEYAEVNSKAHSEALAALLQQVR